MTVGTSCCAVTDRPFAAFLDNIVPLRLTRGVALGQALAEQQVTLGEDILGVVGPHGCLFTNPPAMNIVAWHHSHIVLAELTRTATRLRQSRSTVPDHKS